MDKSSHEPSLREVAAWLGQPQEPDQQSPEWAGLDELIRDLPDEARWEFAKHALYLRDVGARVTREVVERMVKSAARTADYRQSWRDKEDRKAREATVYYVRIGSLIKIGQAADLKTRLRVYPPGSMLLATEVGERDTLEAERHQQFRDTRLSGYRREWFHPSAALIEHINTLRDEPLTAVQLAA